MGNLVVVGSGVALALAFYLNYPAPRLSEDLQQWLNSGKFFNHKRHRIFYKDVTGKKSDGPILLLLHGFPTCSYDWKRILPHLLEEFGRVVMFDCIGFGFSDKPAGYPYSLFDQADIAEELMDSLGISEAHVLSHDMGDTVAQELIARQNDAKETKKAVKLHLLSVCITNGGIFPEKIQFRRGQKILLHPVGVVLQRLGNFYSLRRGLSEVFGPRSKPSDKEIADWWAAMRYNDGNIRQTELIQYLPERFANRERWVGALKKASMPLHFVYGPSDPVNPESIVDYYKELVPHPSIYVLEQHVGHYPQWEYPEDTFNGYMAFFRKLTN